MAFPKTLNAAKVDAFTVIAAGDTANDGGFLLSEQQLNNIEASISTSEKAASDAQAEVSRLTNNLATANAAKEKAEGELATAKTALTQAEKDRDDYKKQAEEYGAGTDNPNETKADADPAAGASKKKTMNSMDKYAEEMGVPRSNK